MKAEGFESAFALQGGLLAWEQAGYATVPITTEQELATDPGAGIAPANGASETLVASPAATHAHTFLPGLVGNYLAQQELPMRKELTVLFVDIADSTATVVHQPPEVALALVQSFMEVVTNIALAHCGDVKDYEGDGALLYFESVTEATQAALAIRGALARTHTVQSDSLRARLSLNVGSVVIGVIGTALRRSVALIGPSINLAARLLKQVPPGGIIATETVVERLRQEAPDLSEQFRLWNARLELKGFHNELVTAFHVP
ncbi:MAG TPA: adenylate/guanylate cyclase domain-containing protein [Candidatus Binatia bacterium]|nr:adenylate/guanylate cyclase domain-containing protein [Candidatus Binatia bacterium]